MTACDVQQICSFSFKNSEPNKFISLMMYRCSLVEKVGEHRALTFSARIRPEFVSILEHLLLNSQRNIQTPIAQSDSPLTLES